MLRGEKKNRASKEWAKKKNQLRKMRDAERDAETIRFSKEKSTAIKEYEVEKYGEW